MFDLTMDQVFAVLVSLAVGAGAGLWLWWIESKRRALYSATEAAAELRACNKRIQSDVRLRMTAGQAIESER